MTYIDHANAFIKDFAPYFKMLYKHNSPSPRRLENLVSRFNTVHRRGYVVRCGCSRMAIIADDFVIKMDYDGWGAGRAGGVSDEVEAFELIKNAGFEYLFAEPTPFYYGKQMMIIMPRIVDINTWREWGEVSDDLTEEEYDFIQDHFYDLHGGNFGYDSCDNFVIFDYAWRREWEEEEW